MGKKNKPGVQRQDNKPKQYYYLFYKDCPEHGIEKHEENPTFKYYVCRSKLYDNLFLCEYDKPAKIAYLGFDYDDVVKAWRRCCYDRMNVYIDKVDNILRRLDESGFTKE